jgi:3-hydroxyisobutyrate dehydrogenase-like beta-hydroxyacid dehydrogenase
LGQELAARGIGYIDATVLGSSAQVREGQGIVIAGGESADVATAEELIRCFAARWFHVGPCGSGAKMKLAVNLVLGLNRAALAEGLAFAGKLGFQPELTLEILRSGAAYSQVMDAKGTKMILRDFTPQARLAQHLKDVSLVEESARRIGARVPLTARHRQLLEQLVATGHGEEDNAAIIRAFD